MEQGLSLCPDFVVQGTHENKLTMKISQISVAPYLVQLLVYCRAQSPPTLGAIFGAESQSESVHVTWRNKMAGSLCYKLDFAAATLTRASSKAAVELEWEAPISSAQSL